ncbi:MAG: hypothetical protein KME11_14155 [Timaviella obliquedivisa GSE-PSE-MK23-08B]|jgi:hypothetical protein|nr:hypothetical protein [Timaviella obliquedivisa GSE-PSE-MK23-08B]
MNRFIRICSQYSRADGDIFNLTLNLELAEKEQQGLPVIDPWAIDGSGNPK